MLAGNEMEYWQALVELESGGYDDIPDHHVLTLLKNTMKELRKRGVPTGVWVNGLVLKTNYLQSGSQ